MEGRRGDTGADVDRQIEPSLIPRHIPPSKRIVRMLVSLFINR
jgi:hypothetical protein